MDKFPYIEKRPLLGFKGSGSLLLAVVVMGHRKLKGGGEGEMTHNSLKAVMSLRALPLRGSVPVAAQPVELEFSS